MWPVLGFVGIMLVLLSVMDLALSGGQATNIIRGLIWIGLGLGLIVLSARSRSKKLAKEAEAEEAEDER